jgi:hypothetical protein
MRCEAGIIGGRMYFGITTPFDIPHHWWGPLTMVLLVDLVDARDAAPAREAGRVHGDCPLGARDQIRFPALGDGVLGFARNHPPDPAPFVLRLKVLDQCLDDCQHRPVGAADVAEAGRRRDPGTDTGEHG